MVNAGPGGFSGMGGWNGNNNFNGMNPYMANPMFNFPNGMGMLTRPHYSLLHNLLIIYFS